MNHSTTLPLIRFLAVALALTIAGCGDKPVTQTAPEAPEATEPAPETAASIANLDVPEKDVPAKSEASPETGAESNVAEPYPEIGVLTEAQAGDLKCYVTVRDPQGQVFDLGATFEICDRQGSLLNQNLQLIYSEESVADCQSAEPCGQTRQETLVSDAVILGDSWNTYSNGQWTVTVGRIGSWDGTNNTGSLTYYGCDRDGNCLSLTDGFMVCRNGICNMSWENGNYAYTLSSELTETGDGPTTLLVWQDATEILRAENMEVVDSSEF
ncbi:MAG: hypothetical protein WBA57_00170 [Elainellaceae cyanobacterium]